MAGHSQFKNIMHRKGAQDRKKAKIFTRLLREISVAAKDGHDPETNSKLRSALQAARAHNVPKDKVERARKAVRSEGQTYESLRYEAFGPEGVALMIELHTTNKNRAATDVRTVLRKYGGNLGVSRSVQCLFQEKGWIVYESLSVNAGDVLESALEWGVLDIQAEKQTWHFFTEKNTFLPFLEQCQKHWGPAHHSELGWFPLAGKTVQDSEKIYTLIDNLESLEDVEGVWSDLERFPWET